VGKAQEGIKAIEREKVNREEERTGTCEVYQINCILR